MNAQSLTIAQLASNTLIAIDNAQQDLPQYHNEIENMKRDMHTVNTPQAKLCLYILRDIEAMYEGTYEA